MATESRHVRFARVLIWTFQRRENERAMIRGIVEYVRARTDWELTHWVGPCDLSGLRKARGFDGGLLSAMATVPEGTLCPFPAVALDCRDSALHLPIVRPDYVALAERLVDEAVALGHTSVAYAGPDQPWSALRRDPLADECRRRGVGFRSLIVPNDAPLTRRHRDRLAGLTRPFALVTPNARYAHTVLDAAKDRSIAVPEEMALIAIGDDEIEAHLCHPTLSTVDHNSHGIGRTAAEVLHAILRAEPLDRDLWTVGPGPTVHRGSTGYVFDDIATVDALTFIRDHACDGIHVEDVMERLPISRRALEQRFRRHLGRTIHEEIMRVRLDAVMQRLRTSSQPLADIAAATGFQSSSDLCKIFKRRTGMTPNRYRRQVASTGIAAPPSAPRTPLL